MEELLNVLKIRFETNMNRHKDIKWEDVEKKISSNKEKMLVLSNMEKTGGEPDVVKYDSNTNEYVFFDCSKETPLERRNVCYDKEALDSRKNFKPKNNA